MEKSAEQAKNTAETAKIYHRGEDGLLDEIAQSLKETERTDAAVSGKLANIANKRWLRKVSEVSWNRSLTNTLDQWTATK